MAPRAGNYRVRVTFKVRQARAGDGAGCARVWLDSARFFTDLDPEFFQLPDADGLADWFESYLSNVDESMEVLVAEADDEIIGAVLASLQDPVPDAHRQVQRDLAHRRAYVNAIGVAEAHRRRDVGETLMTAVEQWAVERGAQTITLETEFGNYTSMPFYQQRMGYQRQSVVFRKRL